MKTLTHKQISRQDFVDNKIYELLNALIAPAKKIDWDIETIGNIRDAIREEVVDERKLITEHWVDESAFCPNCGHFEIDKYPNNQPVADFFCSNCREDYELIQICRAIKHSVNAPC